MNRAQPCRRPAAFTLLEVMIALAIFFTATFALLSLLSNTLRNARALQVLEPDLGQVVAPLAITNSFTEETRSGDFGSAYKGYRWSCDTYPVASNNLWEADVVISHKVGRNVVETHSSVLFYPSQSPEVPVRGGLQ